MRACEAESDEGTRSVARRSMLTFKRVLEVMRQDLQRERHVTLGETHRAVSLLRRVRPSLALESFLLVSKHVEVGSAPERRMVACRGGWG